MRTKFLMACREVVTCTVKSARAHVLTHKGRAQCRNSVLVPHAERNHSKDGAVNGVPLLTLWPFSASFASETWQCANSYYRLHER